jgi:hypothetical protein
MDNAYPAKELPRTPAKIQTMKPPRPFPVINKKHTTINSWQLDIGVTDADIDQQNIPN